MAGLKSSITKKFEKQFAELGDIEELKQLKTDHEKRRQEEQLKRGEFEENTSGISGPKGFRNPTKR